LAIVTLRLPRGGGTADRCLPGTLDNRMPFLSEPVAQSGRQLWTKLAKTRAGWEPPHPRQTGGASV